MAAYTFIPRFEGENVWEESNQVAEYGQSYLDALGAELRYRAKAVNMQLVSETPVAGWCSKAHSWDGKEWPCNEKTNGARPVWIWTAR